MSYNKYLLFFMLNLVFITVKTQYYNDIISNRLYSQGMKFQKPNDPYLIKDKLQQLQGYQQFPIQFHQYPKKYQLEWFRQHQPQDKVKVQLFYECLCPDCRIFDTTQFAPTIKKLGYYLDIHLYPYGNAKTIIHADGKFEITCQHGPAECYGNKLHACAIDILGNITQAVEFNSCMMSSDQKNAGSDDEAADQCARQMNIKSEAIKTCAKSARGMMLLKKYGEESKKVGFKFVPHILINGVENNGDNFLHDVCAAFVKPPPECNQ